MDSLVSVIIPAYNHEKYVQETINSIINQTYKNIELIIIDDGSKDNTWQKITEMEEQCKQRFTNVVFKTQENKGTCITLNRLIEAAKGEYIYLIASDDLAKPNAISRLIDFLSKNPDFSLAVGDNEIIDAEDERLYLDKKINSFHSLKEANFRTYGESIRYGRPEIDFNSEDFGTYSNLIFGNHVTNGYLIRADIFNKISKFTPEAPLEDYFLMLQISKYSKLKFIDEILFSYRWHSTNTINNRHAVIEMTNKTLQYEEKLVQKIDLNSVNKNALAAIKYGAVKNMFKIPFLMSVYKLKNYRSQKVILKIFGFEIVLKEKFLKI